MSMIFTCFCCKQEKETDETFEEALAKSEAAQRMDLSGEQDLVAICDNCHDDYVAWMIRTGRMAPLL